MSGNRSVRILAAPIGAAAADAVAFGLLLARGSPWYDAQLAAFGAGMLAYALLCVRTWREAGAALLSALVVLALRGGLLATLVRLGLDGAPILLLVALPTWFAVAGILRLLERTRSEDGWRTEDALVPRLLLFVVLGFALRVVFLLPVELMHEEAYYWLYAWHLDYGYLDHPPLVAWTIAAGTWVAGQTELGVRLLAPVLALGTAAFVHRLATRLFDRVHGWLAVALLAVFPYLFFIGFVAFPDTPLVFCWAGAVYFFHRELIDRAPHAWLGVGVFLGLGLLAKYTVALLGLAGILFSIVDRPSRGAWRTWRPYAALLVAAALFSPVWLWNAQHDWISFARQSTGRLASRFHFMLPTLILFAAVHLTPLGIVGGWHAVRTWWRQRGTPEAAGTGPFGRPLALALTLVAVPLAVVVLASFSRNTKFNWTGPMWLPLVPYVASWMLLRLPGGASGPRWRIGRHAGRYAVGAFVVYALGLYYLGVGVPGVPHARGLGTGWQGLGARLEALAEDERAPNGARPQVVGLDGDTTPAWIAFYRCRAAAPTGCEEAVAETSARHLFGDTSNMFELWCPPPAGGADLLVVTREASALEEPWLLGRAEEAEPVFVLLAAKNGRPAGSWYARWLRGYRGR